MDARATFQAGRAWTTAMRLAAFLVFALGGSAAGAGSDDADCLRCHGMATLGYQDAATGAITSLHVDNAAYRSSNHASLTCVECHADAYADYPHPGELLDEGLDCLDCHRDDERLDTLRFDEIGAAFDRSVHAARHGAAFTCFDCHDPHAFDVARDRAEIAEVLEDANAICLKCHDSATETALAELAPTRLDLAHAWLPNADLHRRHVHCVDCHTPDDSAPSHEILAAEDARRACVDCHTKDSVLLTKLYRGRVQDDRARVGFVNGVVLNDAYIIGMTRNLALDRASVAVFLAVLIAVGLHALGRWRATEKVEE